jgi:hypothetical protein
MGYEFSPELKAKIRQHNIFPGWSFNNNMDNSAKSSNYVKKLDLIYKKYEEFSSQINELFEYIYCFCGEVKIFKPKVRNTLKN